MPGTDASRLVMLEEKVAYQDKTVAELNEVVVSLNRALSELKTRLAAVERIVSAELGQRDMPNERPPHY